MAGALVPFDHFLAKTRTGVNCLGFASCVEPWKVGAFLENTGLCVSGEVWGV
jgi:hypothetical protein